MKQIAQYQDGRFEPQDVPTPPIADGLVRTAHSLIRLGTQRMNVAQAGTNPIQRSRRWRGRCSRRRPGECAMKESRVDPRVRLRNVHPMPPSLFGLPKLPRDFLTRVSTERGPGPVPALTNSTPETGLSGDPMPARDTLTAIHVPQLPRRDPSASAFPPRRYR